ncbi:hypothetical protein [Actinacidiphila soli]|uniref:hypothetical protein n=1 Tax=Actinacidiphila soli TaxID=2487275 RepID=UPI0013E2B58C|nr:hypothetical protein [Actinacidiphila soli]
MLAEGSALRFQGDDVKVIGGGFPSGNRRADLVEFRDMPGEVPWGPEPPPRHPGAG